MKLSRPIRFSIACLAGWLVSWGIASALEEVPPRSVEKSKKSAPISIEREVDSEREGPAKVVVIPVRDQIAQPILYVIRRGLKDAIEAEADLVVLDMETPGGSLGVTFEIMEALDKFDGQTATFVNKEAISAGAFISAMTDDIYFAPTGVIGAAAPVMSSGGEIDETMRQKIVSYLRARIRAISEGHAYRGAVISAMVDADYVLEVEGEVLKPAGELLSLTATEAAQTYGDPAEPLLAAGIADTIDDLLEARFGAGGYEVTKLETTWSEDMAALLNGISPILMGLGLLGFFIEFKTPGFGIFGIGGGLLLLIVFFGHNVAGLSGSEPMLLFFLGVLLVFIEVLLFPGIMVAAITGIALMLGSLVWSMADIWPNQPIEFSADVFMQPIANLLMSIVVAVIGGFALMRFLPHGWFWDKMVLASAVSDSSVVELAQSAADEVSLVGQTGIAVTDLYPSGQVEIEGQWQDAKLGVGTAEKGTRVRVVGRDGFGLMVTVIAEEDEA
jgi:membrane-bound serine protease (ClpP class)